MATCVHEAGEGDVNKRDETKEQTEQAVFSTATNNTLIKDVRGKA